MGQSIAESFGQTAGASSSTGEDQLGDLIKRNNGWAGVPTQPTFAEDMRTRRAINNPYGLPTTSATQLISDQGWAPTANYGYAGVGDGVTNWRNNMALAAQPKTTFSDGDIAWLRTENGWADPDARASGVQYADRWGADPTLKKVVSDAGHRKVADEIFTATNADAANADEGDPTPLGLRSKAEFRDLGRTIWNGLVDLADSSLMVARGALRLYDRNPDGSPNLKSLTSPILDDWRLNYESEAYRDGLGLFGELVTGAATSAGVARLARIRNFGLTLSREGEIISGAATKSHATEALWIKNSDGPRSLEAAVNLADEAESFGKSGMVDYKMVTPNQAIVDLGDGVKVKYVVLEDSDFIKYVGNGSTKFANYETRKFDPSKRSMGAKFTDLFEDGTALVQARRSVLESDRTLVAILGHETLEVSGIGAATRAGMKFGDVPALIGRLHIQAVDFADGLVRQLIGK